MTVVAFIGVMLLGWALGKNNLSNLFGTAVGTRMVRLRTAEVLAFIFILAGAMLSGSATTSSVLALGDLKTPTDLLVVLLSAALIMEVLSKLGIPASIVQTVVGSLIGWNLYRQADINQDLVKSIIGAWIWAPIIAAFIGFFLMKGVKKILMVHPISLVKRDLIIRICLIGTGILASYTLGANNIGTMTGPFLSVFESFSPTGITFGVSLAIGVGCLMADKKVIETVGKKLFPLSPAEGFIVMIGTAVSMIFFSLQSIRNMLHFLSLPAFPLVPIPMSNVMIGAIVGISLTKGGYGLRYGVLGRIILAWFFVPILSGLLAFSFLMIGSKL